MKWSQVLKSIIEKMKAHLFFIILLLFLSLLNTGLITFFFVTPVYESSADLLIHSEEFEADRLTRLELTENVQFIPTYKEFIHSSLLLEQVIVENGLDVTAEQLRERVDVASTGESQVVTVSVRDENPESAALIANKLVELSKEEIRQLINRDNVMVLAPATTGEKISGSAVSLMINMGFAAAASLICGGSIVFLMEYFDNTVKDEQDVQEILGLPVLGCISSVETAKEEMKCEKAPVSEKVIYMENAEKTI